MGVETVLIVLALVIMVGLLAMALSMRVVKQFERGVVFRLGKVESQARQPGLTLITPFRRPTAEGQHADHHDAGAGPRRDHPRQRHRPGRRGGLLPRRRPAPRRRGRPRL